LKTARKLLGKDAIIGVTVSTVEEAQKACREGADYLGIGTMFATPTYVLFNLLMRRSPCD
jgi:thiamine-phosphate diphosphorylase/hydroxyethylthiazole kinase